MLLIDQDPDTQIRTYMVCNDLGFCLIRTTSSKLATYINKFTPGLDVNLRLLIGGDLGTKNTHQPLFHHIRRITR